MAVLQSSSAPAAFFVAIASLLHFVRRLCQRSKALCAKGTLASSSSAPNKAGPPAPPATVIPASCAGARHTVTKKLAARRHLAETVGADDRNARVWMTLGATEFERARY